jgi:hypothetical protein
VTDAVCTHLDQIEVRELPAAVDGCEDCLRTGEDWNWCYVDEVAFLVDGISGKTRIPPSPLLRQ